MSHPPGNQPPMISLRGVTKAFSTVLANDQIDLDIFSAEIHALLGENGAGKSTLMKILFGFYRADAGEIRLNGKTISIHSPHDARAAHIGMVFQDLNLIPAFTVAENIALFLPDLKAVLNPQEINRRINDISRHYGLEVNPQTLVSQLSIGEQQKVEILKLLLSDAKLLILDEPTRGIDVGAKYEIYTIMNRLIEQGMSIIMISSELPEILGMSDRIYIVSAGRISGELLVEEASQEKIMQLATN